MRLFASLLVCLAFAAAGCGGPASHPPTVDDMKATALNDVAELYRLYTLDKKKAPTKVADFAPLEAVNPTGLRALRDGEIVVRLGATLPDTGEEPGKVRADEILAYEREVPASGGNVLMLDRTVRRMDPDEFKSAKLAGTSSSEKAAQKKS